MNDDLTCEPEHAPTFVEMPKCLVHHLVEDTKPGDQVRTFSCTRCDAWKAVGQPSFLE